MAFIASTSNIGALGNTQNGLTALAGGGVGTLSTAVKLSTFSVIGTCATAADSAILPDGASQGTLVFVRNNGAAACAVFPNTGATINGGTATTGSVSVTNAKGAIFYQVGTDGLAWATAALAA